MKFGYRMKNYLVIVSLLVIVQSKEANGECKNWVFFSKEEGHYLRRHSIENLTDVTLDLCQITCYMHISCMSYNYLLRSATCEINDADKYSHPEDLVRKARSVYVGKDNACRSNPCPRNATCQPNVYTQSYSCLCPLGFSGPYCTDIYECALDSSNCSINHTCINTAGSYDCICKPGYEAKGITCKDIDECALDSSKCSINHTCINTAGSYDCICKPGYEAQGITCIDFDECETDAHNCSADRTCVNTDGSFECRCNNGSKMFENNCMKIVADYVITVDVEADTGASTHNINVFIKLHGSQFKKRIISSNVQLFGVIEQGSVDPMTFNGKLPNMESISKITMSHDNTGSYPSWYLAKVIVDNKTRRMKHTFECPYCLSGGLPPWTKDIQLTKPVEHY